MTFTRLDDYPSIYVDPPNYYLTEYSPETYMQSWAKGFKTYGFSSSSKLHDNIKPGDISILYSIGVAKYVGYGKFTSGLIKDHSEKIWTSGDFPFRFNQDIIAKLPLERGIPYAKYNSVVVRGSCNRINPEIGKQICNEIDSRYSKEFRPFFSSHVEGQYQLMVIGEAIANCQGIFVPSNDKNSIWKDKALKDFSKYRSSLPFKSSNNSSMGRVKQIDCIYFFPEDVSALEIELSTDNGIPRMLHLKDMNQKSRMYEIVPDDDKDTFCTNNYRLIKDYEIGILTCSRINNLVSSIYDGVQLNFPECFDGILEEV